MKKTLFIRRRIPKSRLRDFHKLNLKILCYSLIFIAALQVFTRTTIFGLAKDTNLYSESFQVSAVQDVREIKPGELVEGSLKSGDKHSYKIKLEAGQSLIIRLVENDLQLTLSGLTPDGEIQAASEVPSGGMLFEDLIVVADQTGFYGVNVTNYRPTTYTIQAQTPHKTTERDKKYLAALKLSYDIIKTFWDQSLSQKEKYRFAVEKTEGKLSIYQELSDKKLIAIAFSDLGYYLSLGLDETSKAFKYLTQSIQLLENLNDPREKDRAALYTASDLGRLGELSQKMGDFQKALDYFHQGLNILRSRTDANAKERQSRNLGNIGVIYHLLADEQRAQEYYEQSLEVSRSITPQTVIHQILQGLTLSNIGNLYRGIGADEMPLDYYNPKTVADRQKALEYYKQALELAKNTGNKGLEGFALTKIGNTYKELGNFAEATIYLEQSLNIFGKYPSKDQFTALRSIGNLYLLKGEFQKGVPFYEQALDLLAKLDNKPELINVIAKDYYAGGDTQKALELYNQSLALSRERSQTGAVAASLFEIARIERDQGNFANARNRIEEAVEIVESIRAKIAVQDVQATYFATVKRYYDFYIDLLMQAHKAQPEKGFDALALETSEKARSRSLLDLLSQARVDIKQGVDQTLLEREKQVREKLIEKANQQNRLLLAKHTKEEAEKIKAEISNLTAEYEAVQSEIKNKSPRYAALTQPQSIGAKQIQRLLDSGTVLLEYSLGEKKSCLWAVTNDSIASFDLPKREEIEAQARKVYELLTVRNESLKSETDAQRSARIKTAEEQYPKEAAKLSQMLIAPAASQIGNKRLLIVADGALNYIPFAALPALETANSVQPLSVNHEIATLPSASILALLREETQTRKPAPKMLAVFADPVFSPTDVRADSAIAARTNEKQSDAALKSNTGREKTSYSRDFERAVSDVGLRSGDTGGLPRLPFSRREADSIFRVAPKNLSLKEIDFDANKAAIFESNLEQYRILHFATHGLLNSQHPELSGIVLSLLDKKGGEVDGFLRLQDIYNLKLSADLVVLSACNTALGKDVKGEGLIGLTRGFMYAGSPRVVASLWKVDDAATAEFMSVFYRKMLAENLRPAAALRAAQSEMMKQTRWKSPYYWAPFIIQGEWK